MPARHASPTGTTGTHSGRLDGLDLARGLAVLSMLVAHLSPVGGVLDLSEYLTAPLFAVVIGASMALRLERGDVGAARFVGDNALRGLLLLVVGLVLQLVYRQIDVVLPYLGVLVVVLAPLAVTLRRLPVLASAVAVAGAVLGPIVVDRAREVSAPGVVQDLLVWTATGESYRLVSFLPMALGGLVLAGLLPRLDGWRPAAGISGVLLATSLVVHLMGRSTVEGAAAYSGTTAEVVAATLLAAGAVTASFALLEAVRALAPPARAALSPVLATGRLAFTAYTVQILVLAAVSVARDGAPDDGWVVLLGTTFVVLGTCWALEHRLGTGPLEVLDRAVRVPVRGRHAGHTGHRGHTASA
ncbi:hypothetical protein JQN72_01195 [Phycicoccus sp. CSK15P-2]|uniref:hypothetical protein n=1 Tax=Phycicoccus sp. CSK15P-2 TaxID=2807627 RepID=UPI00194DC228|nr:hypothetical protein [Phycicoccus sp. CSK15P-2]MBM6402861.1 hypothetical protein [Phycicoccus sp. CSK15P-2]